MFENPRGGRQARKFTTSVPKILDLKSSSEQNIISENCRWLPLVSVRVALECLTSDWSMKNCSVYIRASEMGESTSRLLDNIFNLCRLSVNLGL